MPLKSIVAKLFKGCNTANVMILEKKWIKTITSVQI